MRPYLRLLAAGAALLLLGAAAAPDRQVRIFGWRQDPGPGAKMHRFVTGDSLQAAELGTILFTEEACPLQLVDKRGMHRAWRLGEVGCWYPTLDGRYVYVTRDGERQNQSTWWESMPRAALHPDGSATITEPNYQTEAFEKAVNQRKVLEEVARLRTPEKP